MTENEDYYEMFVSEVVERLYLDAYKEKEFRGICKLYGVDWKLWRIMNVRK